MADRLDAALADLATAVEFPPTPDLRRGVADRLAQPARRPAWSWPLRRALVLAVIALLALASAAVGLGLVPGLRLTFVAPSELPSVPIGEGLELGDPVPVGDVAAHVPAALGPPTEAYRSADGRVASLVYRASDELPALAGRDVGLLVQAFEGALDREQIEKLVEAGSSVTPVSVGGASGYWIAGPPHAMRYLDADGRSRAEETRLVGDTLVWADGGTLYRIESGLGMAETLRIAETIGD